MPSKFGFHEAQDSSDDGFWLSTLDALFPSSHASTSIGRGPAPYMPPPTSVVLPDESIQAHAAVSNSGSGGPGAVVAEASGAGLTINLIFDAAAMAAPASFRSGIEQAASLLSASISDKITLNFNIDYSGTGGGAAAGPDNGQFLNYSTVRADLVNDASSGDTTFNALPGGASIQGESSVAVWNAQLKLWGVIGANDTTTDDGSATFATDIDPSLLVGVALHELTHAMGRVPYGSQPDIFDFYRFTSPGVRLLTDSTPASAAYFSLDGGSTKLADYGQNSDPSDFLNTGVQGPNDPFNEYYTSSTLQQLTTIDLNQLDALGFHIARPDTQPPSVTVDNPLAIEAGGADVITSSFLSATDDVSLGAQLHFTITSAPTDGTLLLNGSPTTSFTETDIDNGLVTYHETGLGATSDNFQFTVTDAAGYATSANTFQIGIDTTDTTASHATGKFSSTDTSDILWYNDNGAASLWTDGQLSGAHWIANAGAVPSSSHIVGVGDFDGNGVSDILWRDDSGAVFVWNDGQSTNAQTIAAAGTVSSSSHIAGVGDFDGNGKSDILWHDDDGSVFIWDNGQASGAHTVAAAGIVPSSWHIAGVGDFDGNGHSDILWHNDNGAVSIWDDGQISGAHIIAGAGIVASSWHIVGVGDFDGNGQSDILWENDNGAVSIWDNGQISGAHIIAGAGVVASSWHIVGVGDFDGSGHSDILWENDNGAVSIWDNGQISGAHIIASAGLVPGTWHIA